MFGALIGMAAGAGFTAASRQGFPDQPDYAKAYYEGMFADMSTLPMRRDMEMAMATGGKTGAYYNPLTGKMESYDFAGKSNKDMAAANLDWAIESNSKLSAAQAKNQLELSQRFGPEFIKLQQQLAEQADPTGTALRKKMGDMVSGDLASGYGLAPGLADQVVQAERAGQASRGNLLGRSSGAAEAMSVGAAATQDYQRRLANASAFLSGTPSPTAMGAQAGAAGNQWQSANFMGSSFTNPMAMTGLNPNAGMNWSQMRAQEWGDKMYRWQQDPWTQYFSSQAGMGSAQQAQGGGMGGMIGNIGSIAGMFG